MTMVEDRSERNEKLSAPSAPNLPQDIQISGSCFR